MYEYNEGGKGQTENHSLLGGLGVCEENARETHLMAEPPGAPRAAGSAGPAGFGRRGAQCPRAMEDKLSPARHARSVGGAAGARLARHRRGPARGGAVPEASPVERPPHRHAQSFHVSW